MAKRNVIENCSITLEDSEVKTEYNVWDTKSWCDGTEIYADKVYSPCKGIVIQEIKDSNFWSITVQYSEHIALRFSHMKDLDVRPGEVIETLRLLGHADKYVHFEYLTIEDPGLGRMVTFPPNLVFYKHDPRLVLDHNIIFDETGYCTENIFLEGLIYHELSNNKGVG